MKVDAEPEADNSLSLATDYRPLELEKEIRNSGRKTKSAISWYCFSSFFLVGSLRLCV
jgi:hypothetical protein